MVAWWTLPVNNAMISVGKCQEGEKTEFFFFAACEKRAYGSALIRYFASLQYIPQKPLTLDVMEILNLFFQAPYLLWVNYPQKMNRNSSWVI
jgi:hypothetical protein